jgi:hypothetical protein
MNPLDLNIDDPEDVIVIQTKHTNNYFCPNINNIKNRFMDGITKDNLYKEFKNPYIICLDDNAIYRDFFHKEIITQDELTYIKNSIRIIPIKYNAICESMYMYLTTISATLFNSLNTNSKIIVDNDVLVCCLFRFKYLDISRYLKQFDGISHFIEIYNSFVMNEYFGLNKVISNMKNNHIYMIDNMSESNYWTNSNNCRLNYTIKFKTNSFNLSINERLTDKKIDNVLKYLASMKDENDYLAFLFKKSTYIDASSGIDANGFKLYTIPNNQQINLLTNEHINSFFDKLLPDVQYHLIMNCLISKELCHLIINNKYIIKKIMSKDKFKNNLAFMELYGQLFRYIIGYTWIVMYMEESIKRSQIKSTDRFVFDIDTASLLPWYPYSTDDVHVCPYLPILVAKNVINTNKNILGIEQHIYINQSEQVKEVTRYGVAPKDKFISRINIFISGIDDVNILKDINWNNIAMSGSIMACCLPNYNTLMSKFITDIAIFDIDFKAFVNEYYKDADIDIMCNISDIYLFVDKINEFNNILQTNIKNIHSLPINDDINITKIFTNKSASVLINQLFIETYLVDSLKLTYVEIISNLNTSEIKEIVYVHYIRWHKDNLKKSASENPDKFFNPKYHEIFIPVPIEEINIILFKNENEFITKINYKFRISSHYLPHNFEFFQVKYSEFFASVSQFHLPIVRSYYDGNQVYLTPSCISACMTLLNIDYKYFAGKKDPIEIINKYRMRGFGTILNEKEITKLIEYSNLVPTWKKLYKLNINSNSSIMNIVGILNINNLFFRPSLILKNILPASYAQLLINVDYNIIPINFSEIMDLIKRIYNIQNNMRYDLLTINKYGYINTVKKWLINAYNDTDINSIVDTID